jgi:hypothetical protein
VDFNLVKMDLLTLATIRTTMVEEDTEEDLPMVINKEHLNNNNNTTNHNNSNNNQEVLVEILSPVVMATTVTIEVT